MLSLVSKLLECFDCEEGVSAECFEFAMAFITEVMGHSAAIVFNHYVDANDGRFYLKSGTLDDCWLQMVDRETQ